MSPDPELLVGQHCVPRAPRSEIIYALDMRDDFEKLLRCDRLRLKGIRPGGHNINNFALQHARRAAPRSRSDRLGSPVRPQLYLKLHREVPTLPGARMCQAVAQQLPRCLRPTACASSGLVSLEHCLKSAAVCRGPSCGLLSPTGAQAPNLQSRQGARNAVSVPQSSLLCNRGNGRISLRYDCGAMRPRCVTTILVGGRAGSSNWFRIQFPVDRYAGEQCVCPRV